MAWIPKKLTREQMAERRAEGVRLLEAGIKSQVQIARELDVSEAAVRVEQDVAGKRAASLGSS